MKILEKVGNMVLIYRLSRNSIGNPIAAVSTVSSCDMTNLRDKKKGIIDAEDNSFGNNQQKQDEGI